jgi:hypothetical protein
MTVAAIKLQLEKYRSHIQDIPKKSELSKMKKPGLVAFLKTVIPQYTSSFHPAQVQTEQPTAHSALPLVVNEDKLLHIGIPTEIDKLLVPQIREQLELYRSHIESIPKKAVLKQIKKPGLIDLLKKEAVGSRNSPIQPARRNEEI